MAARRVAAGLAALALAPALSAVPAHAQAGEGDLVGGARLEIEALTGTLLPEAEFRIQVRVVNTGAQALEGLRVLGTVHNRIASRYELQQALDDGVVGDLWASYQTDVDPIPPRGSRVVAITRTSEELGFARPDEKFGVYPMRVQVQQFGAAMDEARTSLVVTPRTVAQPLLAALVAPIDHAPALLDANAYEADGLVAAVGAEGRLSRIVTALAQAPAIPITVATNGLVLEEAADLADGFTLVSGADRVDVSPTDRQAAAGQAFADHLDTVVARRPTQHIAFAYASADLVALVRGDMALEANRHIEEGLRAARRLTRGAPTQGILWPPAGLDPETLGMAATAGIDTVLLSERYLNIPRVRDLPLSPSPVRRLRTEAGEPITALVPDPWLEELMAEPPAGGLAAMIQRILAETAVVYFERPNAAQSRGLLLAPPQQWDPPPGMVEELVQRISSAPWLRPATLSTLADGVPPQQSPADLRYPQVERSAELEPAYVAELSQARRHIGSMATVLPTNDIPARLDRIVRAAASSHFRDPTRRPVGARLLRGISASATRLYSAVSVDDQSPVTLTAAEGPVPITIRNTSDTPLRVLVRLNSPRYDFGEDGSREVILPAGQQETLTFRVRPLTPGGTYPIRVTVEDLHGALALANGTVVVRSAVYSAAALAVTVGAGVFLLAWWIYHAVRRRQLRPATS
ncbi:MAG TPA: DUF6049 family protein [Egibacteraceae bacterium]|nr:DUF6049 family protein [Egibacteraceae bacterium]